MLIGDEGVLNHEIPHELAELWIDRDLSWLDFNERVLAEALDHRLPLLERAKSLAIFTSNLDEFFMKRIAVLRQSLTPNREALLHELNLRLLPTLEKQAVCFRDEIIPGLAEHAIFLRHYRELTQPQKNEANSFFDKQISQALTPLVMQPGEAFPFSRTFPPRSCFRSTKSLEAAPNACTPASSSGRSEALDPLARRSRARSAFICAPA